jgi:formylglycine-generating enzyme required for sulfatase activity
VWGVKKILFLVLPVLMILVVQTGFSSVMSNNQGVLPELVFVEGGTFTTGHDEILFPDSEGHEVVLTYDFYMGKYEVTFDAYDSYCEQNNMQKLDDYSKKMTYKLGRGKKPVINISWAEALKYCNWLSEYEGLKPAYDTEGNLLDKDGNITVDITKVKGFRLPTEAEWEYAALGGGKSKGYLYSGSDKLDESGWYSVNSGDEKLTSENLDENLKQNNSMTHDVGIKMANELGIYDMSGNVWEWCQDYWEYYGTFKIVNPVYLNDTRFHIIRGGSWRSDELRCQTVNRYGALPDARYGNLGFRIVRTAE